MTPAHTFRIARLASLLLSFAFSVIGGCVGLNAFIKSNQELSYVKHAAPANAVVTIDAHDVFSTGAVITVVCALIAILSGLSFIFNIWCPVPEKRLKFYLRLQSCALFFCSIWLMAALIPYDYFFANRQASISATVGGVPVSADQIPAIEQDLGVTAVYKDVYYLRLVAILPWFAFLFSTIVAIVFHMTARRVSVLVHEAPSGASGVEEGQKLRREPQG